MRWLLRLVLVLMAVLIGLPLLLLAGLNTAPGQREATALVNRLATGTVAIEGLSGRFPDRLRIARIDLLDSQGAYVTLSDVALDWSPLRLLHRMADIDGLTAQDITLRRLPVAAAAGPTPSSGSGSGSLPVQVRLRALHIARLAIAAPVAGTAASLALDGSADLADLKTGRAELSARRLDAPGTYHLAGRIDPATLAAQIEAREPPQGLIASIAKLPGLNTLAVNATLDGPWSAAAVKLTVSAGPLRLDGHGQIDIPSQTANLDLAASAPAMTLRPDLGWQAVTLDAHMQGKFTKPDLRAHLRLDDLVASGAGLHRLTAHIAGDLGQVTLTAQADGLRLPGPKPDLLAAAPLTLQASARLDAPDRPVRFTLAHPLLALTGTAQTAGAPQVKAHLDLPDLAPLATAGGVDLQGHAAFDLAAAQADGATSATIDGTIGVSGGMAPMPALLGPDARIGVSASLHGGDITVSRLNLDGKTVTLVAHGDMTGQTIDLDWQAALSDLSAVAATVQGRIGGHGHVAGTTDNFAAQAALSGEVATAGVPRGPISVSLDASGLLAAPSGRLAAHGMLDGAPLDLEAAATREADGTMHLAIDRADWKSTHAEGAMTLPPHAVVPLGKLSVRMARLDDLSRLLGRALAGSITASADTTQVEDHPVARLQLEARDAGLVGTATVGRAMLDARVRDPATDPDVTASLDVAGLRAGAIGGTARVTAAGKQAALAVKLQTALSGIAGADLAASAAATLDVPASRVTVAAMESTWKGQTLRLLAPARISYAGGVAVDRLRLGLQRAVLELAGRLSTTLDLTASLTNVTAELARAVAPTLQADGVLNAEARLTGTPARPVGTARLSATGLHIRNGPGASLPPASLTAEAKLAGITADVQLRLAAGRNQISVAGTAPIDPAAAMRLRAQGAIDLAVLDPILTASGRRVRGRITIDATATGTLGAPRAEGSLVLAQGDVQDFVLGAHVTDLAARIEGAGDTIRIASLTGRARQGTIAAYGTLGLAGAMPVNLTFTARRATPLASDKLTATLDADLTLRGDIKGALTAGGTVKIDQAEIRIPDKLPASVAVLDVRRPGQPPPPPPAPGPDIALDVAVTAPGQVFIRGRGLFAELAGRIKVGGTAAAPVPVGAFRLRRGDFNLAGSSLTFTSGKISFEGSGKLDPRLDLIATSTNANITATLTVGGFASAPKITLSSIPELPQDEVLAQLLFHQSASTLTPVQLASAAAALAQISGVGGGVFDPLNSVRQGLGLDRLNVGGGQNGTGATVEAGRYVARGVYVGARQSADGNGSQATVQIDLLRGLKLETDVGTGGTASATGAAATTDPYGTSVGLTYQFQY